jgi:hypothetical protein
MKTMPNAYEYTGENIEIQEFNLTSDYQKLEYPVRYLIAPHSHRLCVYAHGLYDHMDGHNNFYTALFTKLANQNVASFVQTTTARHQQYYRSGYNDWAFAGKTFGDELSDVNQVIMQALRYQSRLVHTDLPLEIILIGLSLGGIIMTINSSLIANIHKLLLISTGLKGKTTGFPIVDTYPDPQIIANQATRFTGNLYQIIPEQDKVIPSIHQLSLHQTFSNTGDKHQCVVPGADHSFNAHKNELATLIESWIID